jgi:transposase/predicted DNA-binding protein YlxM (UPF0122 family)
MSRLSLDEEMMLRTMLNDGKSAKQIAEKIGITPHAVYYRKKKYLDSGELQEEVVNDARIGSRDITPQSKNVLDELRSGTSPMRISEKFGLSRQAIYSSIANSVKRGFITQEELDTLKETWKRKPSSSKLIVTEIDKQKALTVIKSLDVPTPVVNATRKLGITKKKFMLILEQIKDDLSKDQFDNYAKRKECAMRDREERIKFFTEKFKTMSYRQMSIKYETNIRTIVLLVEDGVRRGYISEEEFNTLKEGRIRNRKKLDESQKQQLLQDAERTKDIETLSKEYNRSPLIIKKYLEENDIRVNVDKEIADK